MTALTRGVAALTAAGTCVAANGGTHLGAAGQDAAGVTAVALSAVAAAADQKRLVAADAAAEPAAVFISSRNRGLLPRGAGRAALDRGDSMWIPASLLKGNRGACFPTEPLGRFVLEAGVFYSQAARGASACMAGRQPVSRGEAPERTRAKRSLRTEGEPELPGASLARRKPARRYTANVTLNDGNQRDAPDSSRRSHPP